MAIHYRTQAVILKKREVGEADRVFTAFTRDFGKMNLFAMGERKITSKLRGGLEVLCLSDVEFVEGKKDTIVDSSFIERYSFLRKDFRRMRVALRTAETLNLFLKGQAKDTHIWNLLTGVFATLNNPAVSPQKWSPLYYYFFWNLVSLQGFHPNVSILPFPVGAFLERAVGSTMESFLAAYSGEFKEEQILAQISRTHFLAITKSLQ